MKSWVLQQKSLQSEIQTQRLIYYFSFLVWPFGVMVDALRHWRQPWSKNVFWLFCIFFGYAFVIAENLEGAPDSARHAATLLQYAHSEMDLKSLIRSFYSESSSDIDIMQPLITFVVSLVSTNPRILFAVFAMIFGFFHSRNLWYVLNKLRCEVSPLLFLFLLVFVISNPIWNINGFRMWTAAQIYIYGVLPFLLESKTKRLSWSILAIFFHFSFVIPVAVLFAYLFLRNRITFYTGIFILTSFIKEIDLQIVQSYLLFLPSAFSSRTVGYTNLEYAESVAMAYKELNWYIPLASKSLIWVIYTFTLFIFFFARDFLKEHKDLLNLFCFSVLFYSVANLTSLVPSGGRFLDVASTLMLAFLSIFISYSIKISGIRIIKNVSVPLLILSSLVMMRVGMEFYGLTTLIGNPIFAILGTDSAPLITEIKGFWLMH